MHPHKFSEFGSMVPKVTLVRQFRLKLLALHRHQIQLKVSNPKKNPPSKSENPLEESLLAPLKY